MQLFDTWAGDLSPADYREFVAPHVKYIIEEVQRTGGRLFITFGMAPTLMDQAIRWVQMEWRWIGGRTLLRPPIDWIEPLGHGRCCVQGNLDPVSLCSTDRIRSQVRALHEAMDGRPGTYSTWDTDCCPTFPSKGLGRLFRQSRSWDDHHLRVVGGPICDARAALYQLSHGAQFSGGYWARGTPGLLGTGLCAPQFVPSHPLL